MMGQIRASHYNTCDYVQERVAARLYREQANTYAAAVPWGASSTDFGVAPPSFFCN